MTHIKELLNKPSVILLSVNEVPEFLRLLSYVVSNAEYSMDLDKWLKYINDCDNETYYFFSGGIIYGKHRGMGIYHTNNFGLPEIKFKEVNFLNELD